MEQTRSRPDGPPLSPRTAVVWTVLRRELDRREGALSVLDVGGGTGGFAVPLAEAGHRVTVVDASPDALAALTRRAAEAGVVDRVLAVQGDGDALGELIAPGTVDLALCHSVLEVVDDPRRVVAALAEVLRPGGVASVLVPGRAAAVLARAVAGHVDAATELLGAAPARSAEPTGRPVSGGRPRETVRRRYDAESATALLHSAPLRVEQIHGVRVFADLVPAAAAEAGNQALLDLELAACALAPYRDVATQLHLFARRMAAPAED